MQAHTHNRIAVFGGLYSNSLALESAIEDARRRNVDAFYCLGDLGAFGPHPDRIFPLLLDHNVHVIRGNYDDSIGRGWSDCQCGYTDPRDNHFATVSYRYTYARTDPKWRPWLRDLPEHRRVDLGGKRILMCHGSPRRMNEFLWESATSTSFLDRLARRFDADVVLCTHTGIHWRRFLSDGKLFVNVGVLGRPENDGLTHVWYTILEATGDSSAAPPVVSFIPVVYDHERLAAEMTAEDLPEEFVETILTGWWTTCLEILPAKERKRGRY